MGIILKRGDKQYILTDTNDLSLWGSTHGKIIIYQPENWTEGLYYKKEKLVPYIIDDTRQFEIFKDVMKGYLSQNWSNDIIIDMDDWYGYTESS